MLSKVVVLVILIGSACLFLAGIIMVPVGATGVCSRLAITQAGEKQSCFRCTENRCNTCGGSANDVNRCRCEYPGTTVGALCYTSYSKGAIALIVIGSMLMIGAIVGVILMFTWQKKATLTAFGKGGDAE